MAHVTAAHVGHVPHPVHHAAVVALPRSHSAERRRSAAAIVAASFL